jgi:hypothetical protein
VETGLVFASPASESVLLELELPLAAVVAELLELLPPHAVTAIAQAIVTATVSVSRNGRI